RRLQFRAWLARVHRIAVAFPRGRAGLPRRLERAAPRQASCPYCRRLRRRAVDEGAELSGFRLPHRRSGGPARARRGRREDGRLGPSARAGRACLNSEYQSMTGLTLEAASTIVDRALSEGRARGFQPLTVAVLDA